MSGSRAQIANGVRNGMAAVPSVGTWLKNSLVSCESMRSNTYSQISCEYLKISRNRFKVMMESLTDSIQMAEDVTNNSDGYADSLQQKYEESFNGKLQKLESTAQGFWINLMNNVNTTGILDFLTNVLEKLTQLTDAIGSLGTALTTLGTFKAFKWLFKKDENTGEWINGKRIVHAASSVVG